MGDELTERHLRDVDDESAEPGVDAGVALEAIGDGLAQRPEREQAELHQWQHHRRAPRSSAGAREGERGGGAGVGHRRRGGVCCWFGLALLFLERKETDS